MKFLKDSYNGIYKIVLKPYMPRRNTVLAIIIGVIVGLAWAYVIAPVIFYDADPSTLEQSWVDEWVKLLADRYATANSDVSDNIRDLLAQVPNPLQTIDRLLQTPGEEANYGRLNDIRPFAVEAEATAVSAPEPNLGASIPPFIIAPLLLVVILVILSLLWGMLIKPNVWDPLVRRAGGQKESEEVVAIREQVQAAKQAESTLRTDFTSTSYGTPLIQRMSSYILGRGNYDDSFSIEDANEMFLGECGASISEVIGTGDPEKATAIEVWLFDKDDYQRTMTNVFASEYAFNDPALRARLEPKGEVVLAQPGAVTVLETNTLRLQARVVNIEYGSGSLPANSFFQKLTIEFAAWRKGAAGAVASQPVMTTTTTVVQQQPDAFYAPPPQPVAQTVAPQQPAPPPQQVVYAPPPVQQPPVNPLPSVSPYAPPPSQVPSQQDEDDPFGGTGNFTPIS